MLLEKMLETNRFDYIFETFQCKIASGNVYAYNTQLQRHTKVDLDAEFIIPGDVLKDLMFNYPDKFGLTDYAKHMDKDKLKECIDELFRKYKPKDIAEMITNVAEVYVGSDGILYYLGEQILTMKSLADFSLEVDMIEWYSANILLLTFMHRDL